MKGAMGKKISATIYLKAKSLVIYSDQFKNAPYLDFPATIVRYMEILDSKGFADLLVPFFERFGLKGKSVLVILAPSVTMSRYLKGLVGMQLTEEIHQFYANLPFDPGKIALKSIRSNKDLLLVGTNKVLYESLNLLCKSINCEVQAVVPLVAFESVAAKKIITKKDINRIASQEMNISQANFLRGLALVDSSALTNPKGKESLDIGVEQKRFSKEWVFLFLSNFGAEKTIISFILIFTILLGLGLWWLLR